PPGRPAAATRPAAARGPRRRRPRAAGPRQGMTRARPAPVPERARILMVRTSSLGDIVHSLPVLTALRRQLPTATLGWVVEEVFAPVLAGHPDLDQLIVVRLRHW